ncbi:MAG: S-layer protein [Candidatus Aenigmatarchaeota archaeon]
MYKKFVASFMTALMAAMTLVSPALGATALNTYPTFLGKVGDFYVVVGEEAAASDIAGAIDIAANLAQLSYKETTVTGATVTGLTGIERKIAIPSTSGGSIIGGSGANNLPDVLKSFHFTGLKEGQFEYKGVKYGYHEEVRLPTTGTSMVLTNALSSPVNGTLKMKIEGNTVRYRYVFDSNIPSGTIPSATGNATGYTDPLVVTVAGKEFRIVAIPSTTSFAALTGSVGWVEEGATTGLTVGELTALVNTVYSGNQASIKIVDDKGNTVANLGVVGPTTTTFSYKGETYSIRVLNTATVTVAGAGKNQAQLLFGKGDIEKTFDGTSTATITEWGADWKIGGSFAAAGDIDPGNYIEVVYNPDTLTDEKKFFTAGSKFSGPADYFEIVYAGPSPSAVAKVTIEPSGSVSVFKSTTDTSALDVMRGLKLTTDKSGTLVFGATGYDEVYLLFNESDQAAHFNGTEGLFAYKDKASGKIINLTAPTSLTSPGGDPGTVIGKVDLSFGGPGAVLVNSLTFFFSSSRLLANVTLNSTATEAQVAMNFNNKTAASTTDLPELILGADATKADTNDVRALIEGNVLDVSTQVGDILTQGGIQLYSVKSNAEANKVVLGVPPERVYGLVQFGKIGETTTTAGGTVKEVIPVTAAVAKLDTEIGTPEKAKNLVSVGGPCVNKVSADAMGKTFPACGTASGISPNTGLIQVFDGTYTSGKVVVVVAGWEAKDTRLASSVLQNYADKLKDVTASKVTITGTALATATITPG